VKVVAAPRKVGERASLLQGGADGVQFRLSRSYCSGVSWNAGSRFWRSSETACGASCAAAVSQAARATRALFSLSGRTARLASSSSSRQPGSVRVEFHQRPPADG